MSSSANIIFGSQYPMFPLIAVAAAVFLGSASSRDGHVLKFRGVVAWFSAAVEAVPWTGAALLFGYVLPKLTGADVQGGASEGRARR